MASALPDCGSDGQKAASYKRSEGPMKIRALIIEDDAVSGEVLQGLLEKEPDIDLIDICSGGREGAQAINKLRPDLVFLDVQMPEMDGFMVLAEVEPSKLPIVVFVTANEEFAVKAFEVHALDYLVKPYTGTRLKDALNRVRQHINLNNGGAIQQKLSALLNDVKVEQPHPDRLAVKSDGRIVFVSLADIDWIGAADNYVELHVGADSHLMRETMNTLESRLPTERFLRINRSTIVNIHRIKELQPMFHGEYSVVLHDGARLTLSRNYREKLRQLGIS
jgi:two-component system LytT family response regulator